MIPTNAYVISLPTGTSKQLGLLIVYYIILTRFTEPKIKLPTTFQKAHLVYLLSTTDESTPLNYVRLQPYVLTTSSVEFPQLIHSLKPGFVAMGLISVVSM